jgi:hypothetical protein
MLHPNCRAPRHRSKRIWHRLNQAVIEPLELRRLMSTAVSDFHGNAASLGTNLTETTLTPGSVNVNSFGKLFSATVDGQVYAQPLYQPGVTITSGSYPGVHNVAYVATENDSLYAFDANSGTLLWQDTFLVADPVLGSGVTVTTMPNSDVNSSDINPEIGITSTPAIDTSTGFLFLTAKTKQVVGGVEHAVYTLDKVNIASGAFTSIVMADTIYNSSSGGAGTSYGYTSGPYVLDPHGAGAGEISATVNINGMNTNTNVVYFNALRQMNRAGITIYNGSVYIPFASHGDNSPYHGWILGYSESSLAATAVLNLDPDGSDDGIWAGGAKIAMDASGNMYVETGNGTFDTTLNSAGFPQYGDYGDSFIKISLDASTTGPNQTTNVNGWGLKVVDYFTPSDQATLSSGDQDMGSGGPIVLPVTMGGITLGGISDPDLIVGSGKNGVIYLLNANNMGKYTATDSGAVQEVSGGVGGGGSYDQPALFYDGANVYLIYSGKAFYAEEYTIANGVISSVSSASPTSFSSFGGSPMVSANGTADGVVWLIDSGANVLRAYSADNLSDELYNTAMDPSRDALTGSDTKFSTAAVADGEVFVGTNGALNVYGLIAPPTSVPTAPNSLAATAVSQAQIDLTWHDTASNAFGYYVDESLNGGSTWTQIATVNATATSYNAIGLQPGMTYTFQVQAYNSLGDSAFSNTAFATTAAAATPPNFNGSGFTGAASTISFNGSAYLSGTSLVLTNGSGGQTSSAFTDSAFSVQGFNTTFTLQDTSASADGATFTIEGQGSNAIGGGGGSLGYAGITNSLCIKFDIYNNSGEGSNSTGLFINGDNPSVPSGVFPVEATVNMNSSGVVLSSGDVMQVNLAYNGTTLVETITDQTTGKIFTHNYSVNIPSIIGGQYAYLGFTGATGGATAVQKILTWSYTPVAVVPYTPSNLTVTPESGSELILNWSDPYSTVTNYNISSSSNGTTFSYLTQVAGDVTTYNATGLNYGTTEYYEVQAFNSVGSSSVTAAVSGTTPTLPADVSNLNFTQSVAYNSSTGAYYPTVNLTWTNNANNATGIEVIRQQESNNSQYITTLNNTATAFNDNGTIAGDAILLPGVEYDYEVEAINLAGNSPGVDVVVETVPAAPSAPTASAAGTSVTLNWAPYGHAVAEWNIYRGTAQGGESVNPIATDWPSTTYIDSNLTPGTTYYYTITAVDTGGEGPHSTEVHAAIASATAVNLTGPVNYIRRDADGAIDVYSNLTGTGTPVQYTASSVNITGSSSASSLIVDFSAGDPLPASGLTANGSTGGVSISVLGTTGNDSMNVTATTATFNGVPLNYTNATSITFSGGGGSDTLVQSAGAAPLTFLSTTLSDTLIVNGGTYTFPAPSSGAGILPVALGQLTIAADATASLANASARTDRTVLQLDGLSIAGSSAHWLGTLDLGGNDLDLATGGLNTIVNQISEGYQDGTWTGRGIVSSLAATDTTHLTTLGAILNTVDSSPLYGNGSGLGLFDGLNPAATDVLVKYTYYGDTNLDGKVDASDYSRIDSAVSTRTASGWFNGDFNYDATIDGSDYTLIDNAFNSQGAVLSAQPANQIAAPSKSRGKQAVTTAVAGSGIFQVSTQIMLDTSEPDIEKLLLRKDVVDQIIQTPTAGLV